MNYGRYLRHAVGPDTLYRAIAYGVQLADEANEFINLLRESGYEPKYKPARKIDGRPNIRSTDWNVGMSLDVVRLLDRLDIVVIGSNDSNLIPLVQYCRERGKLVTIFSCKVGQELREAVDAVYDIKQEIIDRRES